MINYYLLALAKNFVCDLSFTLLFSVYGGNVMNNLCYYGITALWCNILHHHTKLLILANIIKIIDRSINN